MKTTTPELAVINKLTPVQLYRVVLVLIILFGAVQIIDIRATGKQTTSLNTLVLEQQKTNNSITKMQEDRMNEIDLTNVQTCIFTTLDASKHRILREVRKTLAVNHIDDPERKTLIADKYKFFIENLYQYDLNRLNRLYYKGEQVGIVLEGIDPQTVIDIVLDCFFAEGVNKANIERDMATRLDNIFTKFEQTANQKLAELGAK